MTANAEELIARADRMKADRANFDALNQEIRDLLYPQGDAFNIVEPDGSKTHQRVYDGTGEQAADDLAAFLNGQMTNPASKWMGLAPEDPELKDDDEAGLWCEHASKTMLDLFGNDECGFAVAQNMKYLDMVNYGTACGFIEERPGKLPLFRAVSLSEILIDESHEGKIDTVFRCLELTARQAVQKLGAAVGPKISEAAANPKKMDDKFEFLHCVYPRADIHPERIDGANMPIASIIVARADKRIVKESGYPEMPYVVPRWRRRTKERYGRGPGAKALADVKMLQRMARSVIRGAEKSNDPPYMVADDGVSSPLRLGPNGANYVRSELLSGRTNPIQALQLGAGPQIAEEIAQGVRERIERAFYAHLMRLVQDPRMTATQVLDIAEKTQTALGPILTNLNGEDLGPTVARAFACLQRQGRFRPPPPSLMNAQLRVVYHSQIAKAQQLTEVRAISQTMDVVAPMAQADPAVADNFDMDGTARHVGKVLGYPRDLIRSPATVAKMRKVRAQEQQQSSDLEQTLATVQTAGKALPGLAAALNPPAKQAANG